MVLSHDNGITVNNGLWRQLERLQWSSFVRLSLNFA